MELKKSKWLLGLVVAGGLFCGTASQAEEQVEGIDLAGALSKIKGMLGDANLQYELCKKADAKAGKFSIRTNSGVACKIDGIGAIAAVLCPGTEGYDASDAPPNGSGCYQKNSYKSKAAGKAKLQEMLNSAGPLKKFLCDNQDKLSNLGDVIPKLAKAACKAPKPPKN